MQEKNELREEKSSLKADIENLNTQYQQRLRVMFPWAGIDPAVVMAAPYTYPLPLPVTPSPIPMHPSLQPYPFFGNHAPGTISAPCSTFIPFSTTGNLPVEQPSSQHASSSHVSSRRESKLKLVNDQRTSVDRSDNSNDVVTELELKIPGSSANQVILWLCKIHYTMPGALKWHINLIGSIGFGCCRKEKQANTEGKNFCE